MAKPSQKTFVTDDQGDPVKCLGMTFPNDQARREYFLGKLREKLKDPAFRTIEGFPIGGDEQILALSDPPYYTACPNPFFVEVTQSYGRENLHQIDSYHRAPFSSDVSEGKNDPLYNSHSYHTKVPHKAIMRYILHYTKPGDIVFDGFCGTGMTAVAAQLCGNRAEVESLGLTVSKDGAIIGTDGAQISSLGTRPAIASDLSPIATFIASNLLTPIDQDEFSAEGVRILHQVEADLPWLYNTAHPHSTNSGQIVYTVWSDVLLCSECSGEIDAWSAVVDTAAAEMRKEFPCPHCGATLLRRSLDKAMATEIDVVTGKHHRLPKQSISIVHYKLGQKRFTKPPDDGDLLTIKRARQVLKDYELPTCSFEHTWQHIRDGNHIKNITHSHHYYTVRNSLALAALRSRIEESRLRNAMLFVMTGFIEGHASKRNRYIIDRHHTSGTTCGPLSNTLFVSEIQCEVNVFEKWEQTLKKQAKGKGLINSRHSYVATCSASATGLPDSCVDYIFVDPPFGANIIYSELNLLYEPWLGVYTQSVLTP